MSVCLICDLGGKIETWVGADLQLDIEGKDSAGTDFICNRRVFEGGEERIADGV